MRLSPTGTGPGGLARRFVRIRPARDSGRCGASTSAGHERSRLIGLYSEPRRMTGLAKKPCCHGHTFAPFCRAMVSL